MRDLTRGDDPQIAAVSEVLAETKPDILLLTGVDMDPGGATLSALREALAARDAPYPHGFAAPSNAGLPTGLDLDGDGRLGAPRDAQGYGRFRGDGAMALLSRLPIAATEAWDGSGLIWADLTGAALPERPDGSAFPSAAARDVQRLSSSGHWAVPVQLPTGARLTVLAYAATPPVFDGAEDRNGLRNADESLLWLRYLDGGLVPDPPHHFAVMGRANLDPADGEGRREAIRALLDDPRLTDPAPRSPGGRAGADPEHAGDPALDTSDWRSVAEDGPGNLRVDYVLPSATLRIVASGVHWPDPPDPASLAASPHRLVWVDIAMPLPHGGPPGR